MINARNYYFQKQLKGFIPNVSSSATNNSIVSNFYQSDTNIIKLQLLDDNPSGATQNPNILINDISASLDFVVGNLSNGTSSIYGQSTLAYSQSYYTGSITVTGSQLATDLGSNNLISGYYELRYNSGGVKEVWYQNSTFINRQVYGNTPSA